jgi:hypothetical protein
MSAAEPYTARATKDKIILRPATIEDTEQNPESSNNSPTKKHKKSEIEFEDKEHQLHMSEQSPILSPDNRHSPQNLIETDRKHRMVSRSKSNFHRRRIGHEFTTQDLLKQEKEKEKLLAMQRELEITKRQKEHLLVKLEEAEIIKFKKIEAEKKLEEERERVKRLEEELQKARREKEYQEAKRSTENSQKSGATSQRNSNLSEKDLKRKETHFLSEEIAKTEKLKEQEELLKEKENERRRLEDQILSLTLKLNEENQIRKEFEEKLSSIKSDVSTLKVEKKEKEGKVLELELKLREMEKREKEWETIKEALTTSIKTLKESEEATKQEIALRKQADAEEQRKRNAILNKSYFESFHKFTAIAKNGSLLLCSGGPSLSTGCVERRAVRFRRRQRRGRQIQTKREDTMRRHSGSDLQ